MDTKKLRQKILDLAIRGKLVPQDPNDEPASVLLERIRAEKEQLIKEGKIKRSKKYAASDTSHYENVPFEVPENWEWIKLGECGDVITGMTPSKDNKLYYGGKIPFYKPTDLEQGEYTLYSSDTLSTLGFSQCRQLPCNSILVTCIGATIGKTGIIKSRGACNQQINAIVPYCFLNYQYLYYVCVSNYMQTEIRDNSSSTTLPILNKSKFSELMIPLPPLNEQFRIIGAVKDILLEIENLDRERHNLRNQIHNIKNLVIELAISGKLVPHKPLDESATELLRRINPNYTPCDNRHYENIELSIPEPWCWATVGDVFNHNTGKALNASNHSGIMMDYITTSNLYWDRFDLSTVKQMAFTEKDLEKCTVTKGDLLICEGGDVGRSAIWNYNYDIRIQNHIHRLRGKANICVRYFFYVFMLYKQRNYIGGKGVAIQGLSSRDLNRLVIPLPPLNEQYRIAKSVDNLFSTIDNILLEL